MRACPGSRRAGGVASGSVLSNNNNSARSGTAVNNKVSNYAPGIGLRYQF